MAATGNVVENRERLERAAADPDFLRIYDRAIKELDDARMARDFR